MSGRDQAGVGSCSPQLALRGTGVCAWRLAAKTGRWTTEGAARALANSDRHIELATWWIGGPQSTETAKRSCG
jgi:hypothetical protein